MAKLTSAQLKAMPDEMFGLPKTRQYPLPDEIHVTKAIQFFGYCDDDKKAELAKNINRRAKELQMKIKVQSSSSFYKYADRSVLKEGTIVSEFHIGQLSPIVATDQRAVIKKDIIEKTSSVPKLDKLRRLWAMKNKTLENKLTVSDEILQECLNDGTEFDVYLCATFEAINDLDYMTAQHNFRSIMINGTEDMNLAGRIYDNNIHNYELLVSGKITDPEDIVNVIFNIKNKSVKGAAIAYVFYNSNLPHLDKEKIARKLRYMNIMHTNDVGLSGAMLPTRDFISNIHEYYRSPLINDDDIAKMESFLRIISEADEIVWAGTIHKIAVKAIKSDELGLIGVHNIYPELAFTKILDNDPELAKRMGYFTLEFGNKTKNLFVKLDDELYIVVAFSNDNQLINYLMKVTDNQDPEYQNNLIGFLMGAKVPGFKVRYKTITTPFYERPSLEASDFQDLVAGLQINKLGNISFVLGKDRSWQDKYQMVKSSLEKNFKDENYVDYKNDLCFLFTLIALIHRDYFKEINTASVGTYDMNDATTTFNKAIETFKSQIKEFSKVDPKFIFTKFYLDTNYNNKIEVFRINDSKELEMEIKNTYTWIMK